MGVTGRELMSNATEGGNWGLENDTFVIMMSLISFNISVALSEVIF